MMPSVRLRLCHNKRRPLRYGDSPYRRPLRFTTGGAARQRTERLTLVNSTPQKPTRRDAVSNRERILAAAREALAASGSTSLSAIARKAGVGIGTLYRPFPTRESLILELYRHDIEHLIGLAPVL